jgi:hypothetical protein
MMVYEIEFNDSGPFHVVVTTSGKPSTREMIAGRHRVYADPRFRPGMNLLIDHSQLEGSGISNDAVRALAESANRDATAAGLGSLAIVAPNSLTFGLGRMWEALAGEEFEGKVVVVRSRAEALEWIDRVRDL